MKRTQRLLQAPSATQKSSRVEWSKRLTQIDIFVWIAATLFLLLIMFFKPELAEYCVSMFSTSTAAYVAVRLGYTAKAGVENYRKIKSALPEEQIDSYWDGSNG